MRVALLMGFLLVDLMVGFYDVGWVDMIGAPAEEGQVRIMDEMWPPPPPPPSYP